MRNNKIFQIVLMFLIEFVLAILLYLVAVFTYGYALSNVNLIQDFSILQYATGWDQTLMGVYLASNLMYFVMLLLIFLEVFLFIIRLMLRSYFKTAEKLINKPIKNQLAIIKKISLVTVFLGLRINNAKKGIIAYIVVIAIVFGGGFLAKTVLSNNSSLIYRTYINENVTYEVIDNIDMSAVIENDQDISIDIQTGCGGVGIYQVKNTRDIRIVLLYDEIGEVEEFTYSYDNISGVLSVSFNETQSDYQKYVDVLYPTVEIYIPEVVSIGDISIDIANYGDISMQYVSADSLDATMQNGKFSIQQTQGAIRNITLVATNTKILLKQNGLDTLNITAIDCEADIQIDIVEEFTLFASQDSDIYAYSMTVHSLIVESDSSSIELREVYVETGDITLTQSTFFHANGSSGTAPITYVISSSDSEVTVRGFEYDSESND